MSENGRFDRWQSWLRGGGLFLVAAGAVLLALLARFKPLFFELPQGELTRLAPGLLFLIILVERAVEYLVPDGNGRNKLVLEAQRRRERALLDAAVARNDTAESQNLRKEMQAVDGQLATFRVKRTAETRQIAFLAGLIVAACGFRILQVLVRDWPVDNAWQDTALQGLDLLLSALLLGGGSDFFHRFISAIGRMGRPAA